MPPFLADGYTPQFDAEEADRIRRILDEPGMDLAIELWAGPGAFERLREAAIAW
jgi:hypothetical protein